MTRSELIAASEQYIRAALQKHLQGGVSVYLFGSRARKTECWNSDFDLWVDADIPDAVLAGFMADIEESFVPFKVDIVATPRLRGRFGEIVRAEATPWM